MEEGKVGCKNRAMDVMPKELRLAKEVYEGAGGVEFWALATLPSRLAVSGHLDRVHCVQWNGNNLGKEFDCDKG